MRTMLVGRLCSRRAFLAWAAVAAVCLGAAGGSSGADKKDAPKRNTVRLTIDYNDGAQKVFPAVPWMSGQKVLDVLAWADRHPRGIELDSTGSGPTAFIARIDNLTNEGAGATAKNWLYWLNGEFAQVGAGAQAVMPGDEVLWKFDVFPEKKK